MPTWDHKDSREFRAATRKEILDRYDTTTFVDQQVQNITKLDNGLFEAETWLGNKYQGRKVILATGVKDIYPQIVGYAECWGNSIFHCLLCHGYEERGGDKAGFLAIDNCAVKQYALSVSGMAKNLAKSVTIYTHGNEEFAEAITEDATKLGISVDTRKVARFKLLEGEKGNMRIHFADGESEELSFMAHAPPTQQLSSLVEKLGLDVYPAGDIKVNVPFPTTNIPGIFAVGDCCSPIKSALMAVANGGIAAAAVTHQLAMEG